MTESLQDDLDKLIEESNDLDFDEILGSFDEKPINSLPEPKIEPPQKKKRGRKRKNPLPSETEPQIKKNIQTTTPLLFQKPPPTITVTNFPNKQIPQIVTIDITRKDSSSRLLGRLKQKFFTTTTETNFKVILDTQNNIFILTLNGIILASISFGEIAFLVPFLKAKKITLSGFIENGILNIGVHLEDTSFEKVPIVNENEVKERDLRFDYSRLFGMLERKEITKEEQEQPLEIESSSSEEDDFDLEEELNKNEDEEEIIAPEQSDLDFQELYESVTTSVEDKSDNKKMKCSHRMKLELRSYQKEAVQWMVKREEASDLDDKALHPFYTEKKFEDGTPFYYSHYYGVLAEKFVPSPRDASGGILADQMGLGKTVQMIALMCEHPAKKGDVKTTLVLCPLMIIDQWKRECENHTTNPKLKVHAYVGNQRIKDTVKLSSYDVVLTTYGTLSSEYKKLIKGGEKSKSPLYQINFWRVVLDEGHTIKNRKSLQARACISIQAQCRWVLTGTPIQNSLDDLFTLFQFLKVPKLGEWRYWSKHISKSKEDQKQTQNDLTTYLKKYMIRRTKDKQVQGVKILELPKKQTFNITLDFDEEERFIYDYLYQISKGVFNDMVKNGTVFKNYANILDLLLSLRQICNHPALFFKTLQNKNSPEMTTFLKTIYSSNKCKSYEKMLSQILNKSCDIEAFLEKNWIDSTKVTALIENLKKYKGTKSIIFSQWTTMLDLVEIALDRAKINSSRLDGSMTRKDRDEAIQVFKNDSTVQVCLISLKAGGLGLNLVWASHVYLLDPWWNPFAEEQAIGRIHRFGQENNVSVFRFIINDTIEDKIVKLQKDKFELASSLGINEEEMKVGTTQKDSQKARLEDLQLLFGEENEAINSDDDLRDEDIHDSDSE